MRGMVVGEGTRGRSSGVLLYLQIYFHDLLSI